MSRKHFTSRPLRGLSIAILTLITAAGMAVAKDGYLGVQTQPLNEALLEAFELDADTGGVLVNEVVEDSPAAKAGLKAGDLITAVGGEALDTPQELRRRIRSFDAGEKVAVDLVRRGEKMSIDVELGELDRDFARADRFRWRDGNGPHGGRVFELDEMPGGESFYFMSKDVRPMLGVSLHQLDEKLGDYFKSESGMLVLSVEEDSPAQEAGIEPGDVIVEADGEKIAAIDDLYAVLDEHEAGDKIDLSVLRKGRSKSLEVGLVEGDPAMRVLDELGSLRLDRPGHGMRHFEFRGPHMNRRSAPRAERFRFREFDADALDELRAELKSLREELEELKKD